MGIEELDKMNPRVREKYLEIARGLPAEKRLKRPFELTAFVLDMMAAGLRRDNPHLTDDDIRWELIKRRLPADIRRKVYGR